MPHLLNLLSGTFVTAAAADMWSGERETQKPGTGFDVSELYFQNGENTD